MNLKLVLLFLILTVCSQCKAQSTSSAVFPQGFDIQNGNISNGIFVGLPQQLQQLFRASALSSIFPGPVQITAVALRLNETASSMNAVYPSIVIRLSTTSRPPEQMSTVYAINRGGDENTVYTHSDVRLIAQGGSSINPFDLRFQFDNPFTYDPKKGNLLVFIDSSGASGGTPRFLDAHSYPTLNEESLFASFGGSSFLAPTASGAVVEFSFTSIPEPAPIILTAIFLIIWYLRSLKRSAKLLGH